MFIFIWLLFFALTLAAVLARSTWTLQNVSLFNISIWIVHFNSFTDTAVVIVDVVTVSFATSCLCLCKFKRNVSQFLYISHVNVNVKQYNMQLQLCQCGKIDVDIVKISIRFTYILSKMKCFASTHTYRFCYCIIPFHFESLVTPAINFYLQCLLLFVRIDGSSGKAVTATKKWEQQQQTRCILYRIL